MAPGRSEPRSRILVVEDEPPIVALLQTIMEPIGCDLVHAADGPSALRILSEQTFDLVLLDLVLPGINGLKICRQIKSREATHDTPVLMLTALGDARNVKRGFAAGADDFISKPFNVDIIEAKIRVFLRMSRLRKSLAQGRDFLEGVVGSLASGLLVVDENGVIQRLNRQGAEILLCSVEDAIGHRLEAVLPALLPLLHVHGDSVQRRLDIERRGERLAIGYTSSIIVDGDGVSRGVVSVFRDLGALERARRDANGSAGRGSTLSGSRGDSIPDRSAAAFAHEVANPLGAIQAAAQVLGRPQVDITMRQKLARAIEAESARIQTLAEEYLRPASARLRYGLIDPTQLLSELLELHAIGEGSERQVALEANAAVPPLRGDVNRLKQVLLNLLVNALQATPHPGQVVLRCRTEGERREVVAIEVADSGSGIPPDVLPYIFDEAYSTKGPGRGLGLCIARRIVEEHGGQIAVKSHPGEGTTFTVRLPALIDPETILSPR